VYGRVAAAGTDYLAVDRMGTEIMGVNFDNVRYLNYLWDWGFSEGDLNKIQIIGDTIQSCRKEYKMSFLQKSLTPSFRRKPESRSAEKYWIPGRASLARNDDFFLLSRVLQEAQMAPHFLKIRRQEKRNDTKTWRPGRGI